MASQIKTSPTKTLQEMLTSINYCSIPTFQRSYNWTKKQLESLWESITENEDHYYIGNLVVIDRTDEDAESYFEVIDGQQRITSLNLLLVAVRNFVGQDKESKMIFSRINHQEVINDINLLLTKNKDYADGGISYKLRFHKDNLNSVYQNIVQGKLPANGLENIDDNQRRFTRNIATLSSFIKEYFKVNSSNSDKCLKILIDKIKNLEFILIVCASQSNAYKLFEGLNSTGLELSVVDLVKNSVFLSASRANPRYLPRVENVWQEFENIFEIYDIKKLPKFLRHQWIANEGYVNTSQLFDKIQDNKLQGNADNILEYVKDLRDDAKSYVGLRTVDDKILDKRIRGKYNKAFQLLYRFKWLDTEQVYAVLLSYYKKYLKTGKDYTQKIFLSDLDKIWRFSFIIKFVNLSPAAYEKIYADRCKDISRYSGRSYNKESDKFYSTLSKLVKDREEEFAKNFSADFHYSESSQSNNDLIRYILQVFLWAGESNNVRSVKKDNPSIEHILPRSPVRWGKTEVEIESYVHKIGNLTLLGDSENGSIGSDTFEEKFRKLYRDDIYPKNKKLKNWMEEFKDNPEIAIENRGKEIARIVYNQLKF